MNKIVFVWSLFSWFALGQDFYIDHVIEKGVCSIVKTNVFYTKEKTTSINGNLITNDIVWSMKSIEYALLSASEVSVVSKVSS